MHALEFGQDPGVICKAFGAVVLWLLGYPDAAVRESEAAIAMSEDRSPSSQAIALFFAAMVHQMQREPARSRACSERCSAVAAENGYSFWLAGSAVLLGWAEAAEGSRAEGISTMRRAIDDWQATGSVTYRTYFQGLLADALLHNGQWAEAGELLNEAVALAGETGEGLWLAELHRLRGDAQRQSAEIEIARRAAEDLDRALEVGQRQGAKSLVLRVLLDRATAQEDASGADARQQLAAAYHDFAEGFDTLDLRESRRFLDQTQTTSGSAE
jgi:predicted ATPase